MKLNESILTNLKESDEKVNAKIYQIQDIQKSGYAFMPYSYAKDKLNLDDYDLVASINVNNGDNVLEDIFRIGNTNKDEFDIVEPMRSISVSDIIEINGKKYYVDDFGFKELKESINESAKDTNIYYQRIIDKVNTAKRNLNDEDFKSLLKQVTDAIKEYYK